MAYRPPEFFNAEVGINYDERTDIWVLFCLELAFSKVFRWQFMLMLTKNVNEMKSKIPVSGLCPVRAVLFSFAVRRGF